MPILKMTVGLIGRRPTAGPNKDDVESVQKSLDDYVDEVNNIIHLAAVASGCLPQSRYKPRPYKCPELSEIRDKNLLVVIVGRQRPSAYRTSIYL